MVDWCQAMVGELSAQEGKSLARLLHTTDTPLERKRPLSLVNVLLQRAFFICVTPAKTNDMKSSAYDRVTIDLSFWRGLREKYGSPFFHDAE